MGKIVGRKAPLTVTLCKILYTIGKILVFVKICHSM